MLNFKEMAPSGTPTGSIFVLHGRGVTGEDLMPLVEAMGLEGFRWIFPDGPFDFSSPFGGRSWYELSSPNHQGVLESRRLLTELIEKFEKEGAAPRRIALMGFSQGAVMSLDVGLRYPRRLAGIVGMSGYLAFPERLADEKSPEATGLPILLTHGKNDDILPVEGAREAQAVLRGAGFRVRLQEYLMGHQVIPETLVLAKAFLQEIFEMD